MLAVVAAAHVGLFLLLTASARDEIDVLVERHGAYRLQTAEEPRARPPGGDELPGWLRSQRLWEDAQRYDGERRYVALLRWALLGSFVLQAGVTGVLLYRATTETRRHA